MPPILEGEDLSHPPLTCHSSATPCLLSLLAPQVHWGGRHFFVGHAPSKESCEAPRGHHLTQRRGLEDGGGPCSDKGSPLPAFSTSLFSRNSSVQRGVPADFMSQPQQTNGEEKHPSGALLSSQNLISAQPEGG